MECVKMKFLDVAEKLEKEALSTNLDLPVTILSEANVEWLKKYFKERRAPFSEVSFLF